MIEDVTTALQAFASTGNGFTLTLRDARFLTFKVQGNGNVTAGAVTLECCPQNTPIAPGSGSAGAMVWTAYLHLPKMRRVEFWECDLVLLAGRQHKVCTCRRSPVSANR
jgi:hypothetical protein